MLFFFNATATTEIYTLSLHDALPISRLQAGGVFGLRDPAQRQVRDVDAHLAGVVNRLADRGGRAVRRRRSEEHTSELQSRQYLVCRLLLEKKNKQADHLQYVHYSTPP